MSKSPFSNSETQHEQDVQNLTDFVLFSQRSCILRLSPELTKGKVSFPQFFLLAYLAEEECLSMSNIAKMMGHSNIRTTQGYAKITEEKISKEMDKLIEKRSETNNNAAV